MILLHKSKLHGVYWSAHHAPTKRDNNIAMANLAPTKQYRSANSALPNSSAKLRRQIPQCKDGGSLQLCASVEIALARAMRSTSSHFV